MDLSLVNNCSLTVALRHFVKFLVVRHTKVWKRRGDHQDYLGFYTLESHHTSPSVHGLLGKKKQNIMSKWVSGLMDAIEFKKKTQKDNKTKRYKVGCFLPGQFYHGVDFEVTDLRPDDVQKNKSTTLYVKGHALNVTR